MIRVNLLDEIANVRNTVTPDKKEVPSKKKSGSLLLSLLVVFLLLVLFSIFYFRPLLTSLIGDEYAGSVESVISLISLPLQSEEPSVEEPAEVYEEPAVIVSRGVASDMTETVQKKWSLRFAVCAYKSSCETISKKLADKGIVSSVEASQAKIMTHRIVMGSWTTVSHSDREREKLESAGISTSSYTADGKFYLATDSYALKELAEATLTQVRGMGYEAKRISRKEPNEVYKVYGESFDDKNLLLEAKRRLKAKGVDSVVEKRG